MDIIKAKSKRALGYLSGLLVVLSICSTVHIAVATSKSKKKPAAASAATVVAVAKAQRINMPTFIQALGTLAAVKIVTIKSNADGRVTQVNFSNGQQVAQGMPIIQLDDAVEQAAYQQAKTTLNLDKQKYSRSLLAREAFSDQQLATLKAQVANDQADLTSKLAVVNQMKVVAPFAGVLGVFKVKVGDFVKAQDTIVKLVNTSQLLANYNIPADQMPRLKKNQTANINVSAYPHQVFYGTVNFISPTVSQATRTVAVQALVPNPKDLLKPGMFIHVKQEVAETKGAMAILDQAIMADIKGYYVYKVQAGRALKTYIKVGLRTGKYAQIISGLTIGDKVVVLGQQKLQDGSLVTVTDYKG